jgi:phospholipid/cholesterol/gamma-HCH transport system permease protein
MKPADRKKVSKILSTEHTGCQLENNILSISGRLTLDVSGDFTKAVIRELRTAGLPEIIIDLRDLDVIDSAGVTALFYIKRKLAPKITVTRIQGGSASINRKIELFSPDTPMDMKPVPDFEITQAAGWSAYSFIFTYLYGFLLLAADTLYWAVADIFRSKTTREGEFVNQSVHIGVNATLIIVIMSFAIGFVLAMQSAQYLREFGADIFLVDLVVIGIMSEMGPLITGVLVAGRSGSSIAAEVATMKVTSELDALKTMGLDPIRYVVVPKLYASLFTIPLLIILANVSGIAGGASAAYYSLDIPPEIFVNRMASVMNNKDLLTGFVKSQVYACIIVLTGSFYGFRVEKGAEGVGKVTTQAVVVSLSLVILADSLMAVLFY